MDKLVKTLGIDSLSKAQVSRMAVGRAAPRRLGVRSGRPGAGPARRGGC
jgi:hypothetical protein